MSKKLKNEIIDVVSGGYCSGCGGCSVGVDAKMEFVDNNFYIPAQNLDIETLEPKACPFISVNGENENSIAKASFDENDVNRYVDGLGYVNKAYAGHVAEDGYRKKGGSGGSVSWILSKLMANGLIDSVIHVKESNSDGVLFEYGISDSIEDVRAGAKSRYYPVEMSGVLTEVLKNGSSKRYAVVGLPCFLKSIRKLQDIHPELKEAIPFLLGIVCGHLKTSAFAEMLAWQVGVEPSGLKTVDFRRKLLGRPASSYGFSATSISSKQEVFVKPMADLFGGDWGQGLFKLKACEFCDDVFAETADVVIGDAWLPKYKSDSLGSNVVITRNAIIQAIIDQGIDDEALVFDEIKDEEAVKSQSSGLRHRREGLSYRLHLAIQKGQWVPIKRVEPSSSIDERRKEIYDYREIIRELSHSAFKQAKKTSNFSLFFSMIRPVVNQYVLLIKGSRTIIYKEKVLASAKKIVRKFSGSYCQEVK